MRIVGGYLGGRRFAPPANIPARPTTDLAREALFNILSNAIDLEGIHALDLFGGTGSVSYEMISRGAEKVALVEQDATSIQFIRKTANALGIESQLQVVRSDVFKFLKADASLYSLVFADPPYALPRMGDLVQQMIPRLSEGGLAILEHDSRHSFEPHPHFSRSKAYGDTIFSFFTAHTKA